MNWQFRTLPVSSSRRGHTEMASRERAARHREFASGYAQAMVDVANKILDEGPEAGVEWVANNCPDNELARRLRESMGL